MKLFKNHSPFLFHLFLMAVVQLSAEECINLTSGKNVRCCIQSDNNLWIGTSGGLVCHNLPTKTTAYYNVCNSKLVSNSICAIAFDSHGVLWAATYSEIYKCLPSGWIKYPRPINDTQLNSITCMTFDKQGILWIGTDGNGLFKFNGSNWEIVQAGTSSLPSNFIYHIGVDKSGCIWLGLAHGKIAKVCNGVWTIFEAGVNTFQAYITYDIKFDNNGNTWFATDKGLFKFNGTAWKSFMPPRFDYELDAVRTIEVQANGDIWVGYYMYAGKAPGLNILRDTTWLDSSLIDRHFRNVNINNFFRASDQRLFVCTDNGLLCIENDSILRYESSNTQLPENSINCVYIDKYGAKWFGTQNKGLTRNASEGWRVFDTANSGLKSNTIYDMEMDGCDNLWISTGSGTAVLRGDSIRQNYSSWQYNLSVSIDTRLPCSEWGGSQAFFGELASAVDSNGNHWSSSRGGCSISGPTKDTVLYRNSSVQILALGVSPSGNVWISNYWDGEGYFDSTFKFHRYPTNYAYFSGEAKHIACERDDKIWFSGKGWGGTILLENGKWKGFYDSTSVPITGANQIFIERSTNNKWIATNSGIKIYNENTIPIASLSPTRFKGRTHQHRGILVQTPFVKIPLPFGTDRFTHLFIYAISGRLVKKIPIEHLAKQNDYLIVNTSNLSISKGSYIFAVNPELSAIAHLH